MKAVILAGGRGSRLSEETAVRPKPMVEIGGRPILWHIMRHYARYGIDEFVVCLGYKGYVIKEYFANYALHQSDVTFHLGEGRVEVHRAEAEPWHVTLLDTGAETQTGGRLRQALEFVGDDTCCFTYGDGLADVDIAALRKFHEASGTLATLTAVQPPGRFGSLTIEGDRVARFAEKEPGDGSWLNGGFFVLAPGVARYLGGDDTIWEREPLERLAQDGQLSCFRHDGFWQPMDTVRDRDQLEEMWSSGKAPWAR